MITIFSKPSLLLLALTATATAGAAPSTSVDTIRTITNAQSVTITRDDNRTTIRAIIPDEAGKPQGEVFTYTVTEESPAVDKAFSLLSEESLFRIPFAMKSKQDEAKRFKPSHYITALRYFYWGWNFNYDSKAGIRNAFEYGIADLIGVEWSTSRHTRLGLGLGFGSQRVTTADKQLFATDGGRLVTIAPPEGARVEYARMDICRFQLPLYWRQALAGKFGVSLTGIVNFNAYASATNCYYLERTRYKQTIHGLNQRLLSVDLMASAGIVDGIGVYAKWSPVTSMEPAYGPAFRTFTIGVNLNF